MGTFNEPIKITPDDEIFVTDAKGETQLFKVNVGDAYLNGSDSQIWLSRDSDEGKQYLRKMPDGQFDIGFAVFTSFEELTSVLASGAFYFR